MKELFDFNASYFKEGLMPYVYYTVIDRESYEIVWRVNKFGYLLNVVFVILKT